MSPSGWARIKEEHDQGHPSAGAGHVTSDSQEPDAAPIINKAEQHPAVQKDPAQMTDSELVEAVATEVVKWYRVKARGNKTRDIWVWATADRDQDRHWDFAADDDWSPVRNWNHWREVEEKIMENEMQYARFLLRVTNNYGVHPVGSKSVFSEGLTRCMAFAKADLRTRCLAALQAVRSQSL